MKARVSRPLYRPFVRPSVITAAKRTDVVYLACVIGIVLNHLSDDPSRFLQLAPFRLAGPHQLGVSTQCRDARTRSLLTLS